MTGFDDSPPARAAKRAEPPDEPPWRRDVLRSYVRDRSWGFCEWPECGQPGDEMAHVFGVGSGGRRSADTPSNVAWLCRHHHGVLDGRNRLRFDDATKIVRSLPDRGIGETPTCVWYCDNPPETVVSMRPLCRHHETIATGDNVPGRRAELGLAMGQVVAKANEAMGRRSPE